MQKSLNPLTLLVFALGLFLACNLHAQQPAGVLTAWQLGTAPKAANFIQQESLLSAQQLSVKANYEVWLYELTNNKQALTLLAKLRANPLVLWAEIDADIEVSNKVQPLTTGLPAHFPSLGIANPPLQQFLCHDFPISIIDSGINTQHLSLQAPNLELDFTKNYLSSLLPSDIKNIEDEQGHGTHLAGLIAAKPTQVSNGDWLAGICNPAKLHIQRVIPRNGRGKVSHIYSALEDAINEGVTKFPIINISLDVPESLSLTEQLTSLNNQGQLVVAAAGNSRNNLNTRPTYPASLAKSLPLIISVANFDFQQQALAHTSNYGYLAVDLAAPGEDLLSTWIKTSKGKFSYSSGTSMATPLVSASLAALMQQQINANLPPVAFKAALLNSLTRYNSLVSQLSYPGVLNLHQALTSNLAEVFKPTWLGFTWLDTSANSQSIEVFGYQLAAISSVTFKLGGLEESLHFSYLPSSATEATGKDSLVIDLPANWQLGQLVLATQQEELPALELNLASKPSNLTTTNSCTSTTCAISWQDENSLTYDLNITRLSGANSAANTSANWWLAAADYHHQGSSLPAVVITGTNLAADWQINFSGRENIQLAQLQAVNSQGELITLTPAEGVQQTSNSTVNWLVEDAQPWSQLPAPIQQLVLVPKVTSQENRVTISSTSGSCYIATSVYGSAHAPEVIALRDFRDKALLTHAPGRWLVSFYYQHSPTWVDWLADKPRLQKLIKSSLDVWVKIWLFISN